MHFLCYIAEVQRTESGPELILTVDDIRLSFETKIRDVKGPRSSKGFPVCLRARRYWRTLTTEAFNTFSPFSDGKCLYRRGWSRKFPGC